MHFSTLVGLFKQTKEGGVTSQVLSFYSMTKFTKDCKSVYCLVRCISKTRAYPGWEAEVVFTNLIFFVTCDWAQ